MIRSILQTLAIAGTLALSATAQVRVVTSTPTIADIVKQIGGEHIEVRSIMRGPENPHNVIAKPSYMMALRRADLFMHTGLDAEPWVPLLLKGARKVRLLPGNEGNINLSAGVKLLQVPTRGQIGREHGDIHVFGNPHYLTGAANGIRVARTVSAALGRTDPERADAFERNREAFVARIQALRARLKAKMKPYAGTKVVTYHRAWAYVLKEYDLIKVAEIEPKPGIPPGPGHLDRVVQTMKRMGARVVICETFNPFKNAEFVASRAGGKAVILPLEVRALPGVDSYDKLLETIVTSLIETFVAAGIEPRSDNDEGDRGKG